MLHDKRVGNKFALVTLALKREARQINDGSGPLIVMHGLKKPVSRPLEEIFHIRSKPFRLPPDEGPRFTVESATEAAGDLTSGRVNPRKG